MDQKIQQTKQISETAGDFPISIDISNQLLYMAMSDYSIMCYDLQKMVPLWHVANAHKKKIQQIIVRSDYVLTCSNDHCIQLYDKQSGKLIKQFKYNNEFYSLDLSQHILAGGSEGSIQFYDLRTMKHRAAFEESQNEEVSSLHFKESNPTMLLSASTDGILVQFDLGQENEEESLNAMIRFDQPLNSSNYLGANSCYAVTTTNQITTIDLQGGVKQHQINTIDFNEENPRYLIDVAPQMNQLTYYMAQQQIITQYNEGQQAISQAKTVQKEQIRHIRNLNQQLLVIGEDNIIEVLQPYEVSQHSTELTMEQEANQLFD